MLTIAYIGNGKSANRYHLPFSRQIEGIRVKSIYERSKSIWERIEGINYTSNLDEILNDPEIQLVVLSLPASIHYEFTKKCLKAGKNVLVEKPFTETAVEAKELFNLAKEKSLFVQAYQNRRFDSDFLTVQKGN